MTRGMAGVNTPVMANTNMRTHCKTQTLSSEKLFWQAKNKNMKSCLGSFLSLNFWPLPLLLFVREPLINGKENGTSMPSFRLMVLLISANLFDSHTMTYPFRGRKGKNGILSKGSKHFSHLPKADLRSEVQVW